MVIIYRGRSLWYSEFVYFGRKEIGREGIGIFLFFLRECFRYVKFFVRLYYVNFLYFIVVLR